MEYNRITSGRKFKILGKKDGTKEDFKKLIMREISEGRPVIALGVVGPPEASIIAGYKNNGDALLRWSFFQNSIEFTKGVTFDESGYFICSNWWENTEAVMSIGEEAGEQVAVKELLENAFQVLTTDIIKVSDGEWGAYFGGQRAYNAWADAMSDDVNFPRDSQLPLLIQHSMCFGDATVMVGEGRSYAAGYINWLGGQNPELSYECKKCAENFLLAADCTNNMRTLIEGDNNEINIEKFSGKNTRMQIVELIKRAQQNEAKAGDFLKAIICKI